MKAKVIVTLGVLWLAAGNALANPPAGSQQGQPQQSGPQQGGPQQGQRRPPIERLAADLGLDEQQKAEVQKILEAQHQKMRSERDEIEASGQRPSREEMHQRHEQMDQETLEQLRPVLNEEQLQKFQELRKQHRRGPPGPPPEDRAPAKD
jgi:hypothetical protein